MGGSDSTPPQNLEAALLAYGAVRRGRHLRMRCPAPGHADAHPSADVDLERGWICRACGRGGGLRDLAQLLGVTPRETSRPTVAPARVPGPPPGIAMEDWTPAWLAILDTARRQERRLGPYRDIGRIADWLRRRHQLVAEAQRSASALGDVPLAWELLTFAARVAATTWAVEADLDAVVRHVA